MGTGTLEGRIDIFIIFAGKPKKLSLEEYQTQKNEFYEKFPALKDGHKDDLPRLNALSLSCPICYLGDIKRAGYTMRPMARAELQGQQTVCTA